MIVQIYLFFCLSFVSRKGKIKTLLEICFLLIKITYTISHLIQKLLDLAKSIKMMFSICYSRKLYIHLNYIDSLSYKGFNYIISLL